MSQRTKTMSETAPTGSAENRVRRPDPEDAVIVAMVRAGHVNASAAFFDAHGAYVEKLLVRVLGSDPMIEDLLHDVFVDALASIDSLRDPNKLRPWLMRMTVFAARSHIRRKKRRSWLSFMPASEVPEQSTDDEGRNEAKRLLASLYVILDRMSADERIAFTLRHVDGRTLPEVAEASGMSLATVKRKLSRAEVFIQKRARNHPELAARLAESPRWSKS